MMKKYFIILILSVFLLPSCSFTNPFLTADQPAVETIRVAILREADIFMIHIQGPYVLYGHRTDQILLEGSGLKESRVSVSGSGIHIAGTDLPVSALKVFANRDASIFVNNKSFRGEIDIFKTDNSKLTVVNVVELEKYIKGVLPSEVPDRWPMETLKAQAIAARTYAFYVKQGKRHALYDLTNDIFSQVYGGRSREKYRTNLAVDWTKGLVLAYDNKFLPSYYHSTCAGHTENVRELWNQEIGALAGQPCIFCKDSPHASWKKNMRLKDIQDKLNEHDYRLGLIREIQVVERNRSQRIKTLKIVARDGKEVLISGKDFRNILGPNILKSNSYDIEMKGYYVDFFGRGWGHGVGLCQWGARAMAQQQYRFEDILKYYYPGAKIVHYQSLERKAR